MRDWSCLHSHSDASLLDGLSKSKQMFKRAQQCGIKSIALTDHGNISASIEFYKASQKTGIKPIFGQELYLCKKDPTIRDSSNRALEHLVVLAKNIQGWKSLVRLTSEANRKEHFYYKPRLSLEKLADYTGNLITFSGHPGSQLANILFKDYRIAYSCVAVETVMEQLHPKWYKRALRLANQYKEMFGQENFYIEVQLIDEENFAAAGVIAKALRFLSRKSGIPCVATGDSHYPTQDDAQDQRILIVNSLGTTIPRVQKALENAEEVGLAGFFRSRNYHIPSLEEMNALHTEEELDNSIRISDSIEEFSILSKPVSPVFDCPNGLTPDEYLRNLCRDGWKKKIKGVIPKEEEKLYADRVKMELGVFKEANLSSYFLLISEIVNYARSQGQLVGMCRGSVGGSLCAYLLEITGLDSIKDKLVFERFYNAGRKGSLPDVDLDFELKFRPKVFQFLENKFGKGKVVQIATYGTMKGRSAVKDVLRANEVCSDMEANRITEYIPDESAISDDLQEMRGDNEGEATIIRWSLLNNKKQLEEWCWLNDKGECEGPYAKYFAQAMRLEGTKRSQGVHPAGLVCLNEDLLDLIPMIHNKNSDYNLSAYDMHGVELAGGIKLDALGSNILDKIHGASNFLQTGTV